MNSDDSDVNESSDQNETDEGSDQDQYEEENSDAEDNYEDADDTFQHMSNTDVTKQMKKGACVKNQINMWENLLEMRIHLQKCLIAANKMPQYDKYQEVKKELGRDFTEKVSETKANMGNVLDKLLLLQSLVQKKYPETKKLGKKDTKSAEVEKKFPVEEDEEVLNEENESEDNKVPVKKKESLQQIMKKKFLKTSRYISHTEIASLKNSTKELA